MNHLLRRIFYIPRRNQSFITTPIYYANGSPHIGHLYTCLLADVSHRWEKMKRPSGAHIFSTGTDEHGIKIMRAAEAAGVETQQFCDGVSDRFRGLFQKFGIENTKYIRTTQEEHKQAVQHMWSKLVEGNHIYKAKYAGWYSEVDECFFPEDSVIEEQVLDGKTVKTIKGTQKVVEWVEEENYMFKLDTYREVIRRWITKGDVVHPRHYLPLALRCLEMEGDLSISRRRSRLPWGIPVPGDDEHTIYVWLDALVNYLTVAGYPGDMKNWPPTCHIIGKDIVKFHLLFWPSFLMAAGLPLPKTVFVHGHWLVDSVKMSKSIGNVVDPVEAADLLTHEGLRYFLLKQGVPYDDCNFSNLKAVHAVNSDLVNNLGNLLSRGTVNKLNPAQVFPATTLADPGEVGEELIHELEVIRDLVTEHFEHQLFYKAIEQILTVGKTANLYFQIREPWKLLHGERLNSTIYLSYEAVRILSILLQPIVPAFASHSLDRLGIPMEDRTLDAAVYDPHNTRKGRALGKDRGPFMQRIKVQKNKI